MRLQFILFAIALSASVPAALYAQGPPPTPQAVTDALKPRHGVVAIGSDLATLTLPEDLGYLSPNQTNSYLHAVSHFSGSLVNLGSIVPTNIPLDSPASWNAVITYEQSGHVNVPTPPLPGADILIRQIGDDSQRRNTELVKAGYRALTMSLKGWTRPPEYDAVHHKLSWALQWMPNGSRSSDVSYQFRILGRDGTLSISLSAPYEKLPMIEDTLPVILGAVQFNTPHRYEDFNPATDKVSSQALSSLITGGKNAANHPRVAPKVVMLTFLRFIGFFILLAAIVLVLAKAARRKAP